MVKMDFWERIMLPEGVSIPFISGRLYKYHCAIAKKRITKIPFNSLSLNKEKRDTILTCTLTSFPDRIDTVQYTIKSLFHQSVKPDRIILWLASSEFENFEFPDSIKKLQKQGLEIRFCENFFGHKRYYKLIEEQRDNECIIMFDDDIIFPYYLIERLYDKWKEHPDCVVCERGQVVTFDGDKIKNPGFWSTKSDEGLRSPSFKLLASPGGGCLFPPKALYKDANNTDIISKYALKTGDIWLMFQTVQNDTKIIRTHKYHRVFLLSELNQKVQLGRDAIIEGHYVRTFNQLASLYPHAYENMIRQ